LEEIKSQDFEKRLSSEKGQRAFVVIANLHLETSRIQYVIRFAKILHKEAVQKLLC